MTDPLVPFTRDQLARAIAMFPDVDPSTNEDGNIDRRHEWWATGREFADGVLSNLTSMDKEQGAQRDRLRAALDSEIDHLWAMSRKYGYVGDGSIGMLVDMTNVAGSFDTLRRILSPDDYLTDTGAALTDDPEPAS